MPYDEKLAGRIRKQLKGQRNVVELKMFGGLCFMLRGNMACGVEKNNLVARVGPEKYNAFLKESHARPFDLTGRPLKGFIYVSSQGLKTATSLKKWVTRSVAFAKSLPPKLK